MNLRAFALSDIGFVRSENEDSCLADVERRVFAVADGIGGLPGGAQASRRALAIVDEWFRHNGSAAIDDYTEALRLANESVFELGRELSPRHGIGTTLTLAHFTGETMHVIHVGDSALFRLRGGHVEPLTVDHNLENEMKARAARGEPTFSVHENRAALTRCVGQPPPLRGDISRHPVKIGDRYLICTDGITRCIQPAEIADHLGNAANPEQIAHALVGQARQRGGLDNATVVVVFVE